MGNRITGSTAKFGNIPGINEHWTVSYLCSIPLLIVPLKRFFFFSQGSFSGRTKRKQTFQELKDLYKFLKSVFEIERKI